MTNFPIPAVPDLARASGETRDEVVAWLKEYYEASGGPFNYLTGTRSVKQGYRGLHDLTHLLAGCAKEKLKQGRLSNEEIVSLAAPLAFGRKTQVFDLPRRKFPFGRSLQSGYRIPFFFVENGVVKLYYLQPRKTYNLTFRQISMVATIHKKYLLDTEFFGQKVDVEYVDVSANAETRLREVHCYALSDLELWSDKQLAERLTLIAEALDYIKINGIVRPRKRSARQASADMPLFD